MVVVAAVEMALVALVGVAGNSHSYSAGWYKKSRTAAVCMVQPGWLW